MRVLSLYIHVPFCSRRCPYCSFYHVPSGGGDTDGFVDALVDEIDFAADVLGGMRLETVFVGGGTPSALGRDQLSRVLDAVGVHTDHDETTEITCEVNPEDVTESLLALLADHGVNRVSLGVQSLDPAAQRVLKRCSPDTNRRAMRLALDRFENVSCDALLGIPGSGIETTARTIAELADARPKHLSIYCLEPGGDMGQEVETFFKGVDSERSADEYLLVCSELTRHGYRHYEVSNFAQPGFESAHNRVYWGGGEYLGVGPGAHSLIGGARFHNAPSVSEYLSQRGVERIAARVPDPVGAEEQLLERAMLALRTAEGMPLSWTRCERNSIDDLVAGGFARVSGERLMLTDRGFLVTNDVVLRVCGIQTPC